MLQRVLETVLYYDDEAPMRRFYEERLGMRPIGAEPGRFLFYRAGESVFLLFQRERALAQSHLPRTAPTGRATPAFKSPLRTTRAGSAHWPNRGSNWGRRSNGPAGGALSTSRTRRAISSRSPMGTSGRIDGQFSAKLGTMKSIPIWY